MIFTRYCANITQFQIRFSLLILHARNIYTFLKSISRRMQFVKFKLKFVITFLTFQIVFLASTL